MKWIYPLAAFYLRNTSIERGRYRLLRLAQPMGRKIGPTLGKRMVRAKSGFIMELDLSDWIPQHIYLTGEFEPMASKIAKALLKPDDTAVDVGANIGYFSLLFAQCVGEQGRVLSYEPAPAIATKLKRNIALNRFNNIRVSNLALSDRTGSARFYTGPEDNTGLSSLREPRQSSGTFEVQLTPFDALAEDGSRLTLVKIDVEGAELQVLRGMEKLLRNTQPCILLEVTDNYLRELGDSAAALLAFVDQLGYACYVIGEERITLIEKMQIDLTEQWNVLLTPGKLYGDGTVF